MRSHDAAMKTRHELAAAWLEALTMSAQPLAKCLSVHNRPSPQGEGFPTRPAVRVTLPGTSIGPVDFTETLLSILELMISDHSRYYKVCATPVQC